MYEKTLFRKPLPSEIEEAEVSEVPQKEKTRLLFDSRYSQEDMERIERDWGKPNAVITYSAEFGLPIVLPKKHALIK